MERSMLMLLLHFHVSWMQLAWDFRYWIYWIQPAKPSQLDVAVSFICDLFYFQIILSESHFSFSLAWHFLNVFQCFVSTKTRINACCRSAKSGRHGQNRAKETRLPEVGQWESGGEHVASHKKTSHRFLRVLQQRTGHFTSRWPVLVAINLSVGMLSANRCVC